jgi:hypothetical protein
MTTNTNVKPIEMRYNESKTAIIDVINHALRVNSLPCYMLEPIVADALNQLRSGAKQELEIATKYYNERLAAELAENSETDTNTKEDK